MSRFRKKEKDIILNLERPNTIDVAALDKDDQTKLLLILADGMDWHDEANHLLLLQEKLNNYIDYIESKQYLEKYQDASTIVIQIKFLFKETDNCILFLEQAVRFIETSLDNTKVEIEYGNQKTFPIENNNT